MSLPSQLTLILLVVALVTAAVIAVFVGVSIADAVEPLERARNVHVAQKLSTDLQAYVHGARADVLAVRRSAPVEALLLADRANKPLPSEANSALVAVLEGQLFAKPHYLQARVLGASGQELVRVERARFGAAIRVVPNAELQSKVGRPYFAEAMRRDTGDIYVSPIELNREHGRVQTPHVPVLRTATSVVGPSGKALGIVVINVDMQPAFNRLRGGSPSTGDAYLVNERRDFVVHPDRSREFASDLGGSSTFETEFPMLKSYLDGGGPGAYFGRRQGQVMAAVTTTPAGGSRLLLISTASSAGDLAIHSAYRSIAVSALLAALLAAALGIVLVRFLTRPLDQMTNAVERFASEQPGALPTSAPGEIGVLARAFERMRAEIAAHTAALDRERAQLHSVVEAAPNAKVVVNAEGTITFVNRASELLFGYPRDELLGRSIELLVPEAARPQHTDHVRAFHNSPVARAMGAGRDLRARRKNGSEVSVEVGLSPIELADEDLTLASVIDISERKRYENELRRSNAELEQFAYVASHDLQEPLRVVANYTELLAQRYRGKLDDKADKYIDYAVGGARRMEHLIEDLLSYSRINSQGKVLEATDVDDVVAEVLATLAGPVEAASATVEVGALPTILADRGQLVQVFQNLVANSLKFRSEEPPKVVILAVVDADGWLFSVKDNGLGIDMKYSDRVFQMFQRLHGRRHSEGSGIGLAIVKRIIERHGGRIWLESAPGCGSTFYFTLKEVTA